MTESEDGEMPKYPEEKKEEALLRIAEIGVTKTNKELGIAVPTLYKWRNEAKGTDEATQPIRRTKKSSTSAEDAPADKPALKAAIDEGKKIIQGMVDSDKRVKELEAENAELRETVTKLKRIMETIIREV